jgi:hypothetical protein
LSWSYRISMYIIAQIAGATLTGALIACVGWAIQLDFWHFRACAIALALIAAIGSLHDLQLLPFRLPSRCWQVPQRWKQFHPSVAAACYGFVIGLGVLTHIPFASFYLVVGVCALLANPSLGAALLAVYGAARAAAVAIVARGQRVAADPHHRLLTIARLSPFVLYIDALTLAGVAGLLSRYVASCLRDAVFRSIL